ncbi:hypothetical protein BAE44_0006805 [Dichanthelium oligosanthes]|uniref:Uncharacterized protein n=1 Tax=Dichanthelium oligosanthes TaxID=888268 RepID=A0A1E5W446_9POAL|nr:hypothetical protein BAE44_0006805 [Dichanthelium oligosanthes]
MLPGPVRNTRYDNCDDGLVTLWQQHSIDQDMDSALTPGQNLARLLYREYREKSDDEASPAVSVEIEDKNPHGLAYIDAVVLTGMLLSERSGIPDVLEINGRRSVDRDAVLRHSPLQRGFARQAAERRRRVGDCHGAAGGVHGEV